MKNYPVKKNQELEVDILDLSRRTCVSQSVESWQQIRFCQSDETVTNESRSSRTA